MTYFIKSAEDYDKILIDHNKDNILKKYLIKGNTREFSNGEIIISDIKPDIKCIEKYAYTTHSIQGETA